MLCQLVRVQTAERKDPLANRTATEKILERNLQLRLSDPDWARKLAGLGSDGALAQGEKTAGGPAFKRNLAVRAGCVLLSTSP